MITEKRCPDCKEVKPISEYHVRARSADGVQSACKPCHRHRLRRSRTKTTMTRVEVEALAESQGRACRLCGRPEAETYQGLHLDHDHVTLRTRSLLCSECNTALGLLRDDPELLRRAADYIETHRALPEFNP